MNEDGIYRIAEGAGGPLDGIVVGAPILFIVCFVIVILVVMPLFHKEDLEVMKKTTEELGLTPTTTANWGLTILWTILLTLVLFVLAGFLGIGVVS